MDTNHHTVLGGKIHRGRVTSVEKDYIGSISIDERLMEYCGIHPHEQVHVLNITNGARIITYAIPGQDGQLQINGAAAHYFDTNDIIIILTYISLPKTKLFEYKPKVAFVDHNNALIVS